MCPTVWLAPPVAFLVHFFVRYLSGMALQLALDGFNFPFQLAGVLLHCLHGRVLGGHVIGIFCNLSHQAHFWRQ